MSQFQKHLRLGIYPILVFAILLGPRSKLRAADEKYVFFHIISEPNIFSMDYRKSDYQVSIHYFGENYQAKPGFILGIAKLFDPRNYLGFGLRGDLRYSERTSFNLKIEGDDYFSPPADFKNLSAGGGLISYFRFRNLYLQPYGCLLLSLLNLGTGSIHGSVLSLGLEGGLEIRFRLSEKLALEAGGGSVHFFKENLTFEMEGGELSGNVYYYWETDIIYRGKIKPNVQYFLFGLSYDI